MPGCERHMDTFGNCQRPVFSLGVPQRAQNNKPVKICAQLIIKATC